jgi:hypothetical protein
MMTRVHTDLHTYAADGSLNIPEPIEILIPPSIEEQVDSVPEGVNVPKNEPVLNTNDALSEEIEVTQISFSRDVVIKAQDSEIVEMIGKQPQFTFNEDGSVEI